MGEFGLPMWDPSKSDSVLSVPELSAVIDTRENLRASLVHDALYQLMRQEKLSSRTHRRAADQIFKDLCKDDGVPNLHASTYYKALRKYGKPAASPASKKKILEAPKN